ncbi:class I SAM-dependent methyltransferase [Solihabitans fulvus]|uniref:Class I SAM-dependent methyltransferase n=1 Tax=Solihabitans fulvus TaxID=1892852 RepID=A0A5B2WUK2_9PSEU|nr:class I SAM-dependent methyltransferase [Solihabitans fulvus]KAA2255451.1 class I SAM-dependent methyltransferase [Solihabitans fulvus]
MTNPHGLGAGTRLTFNSPLSSERADRLAADLAATKPATVLDLGCGWGELLLRVLAAAPDASGTGIDNFGPDMVRARHNAADRGLADRVTFIEGAVADHLANADVVISSGAYQAFGDIKTALTGIRSLVNPGGRVLFAAEIWERIPTAEQLANMWDGITVDDCLLLPDLVDTAVATGFRPLRIETSTRGEWEEFESLFLAGSEEWLLANGDHPEADAMRDRVDAHRAIWLRGARDVFGFAFLTLGVPG